MSKPLTTIQQNLWNVIQSNAQKLASDPTNVPLRTQILKDQITLTSDQLGVSSKQAGDLVRSTTALYASSKGYDSRQVLDALSVNEQQILNYTSNQPKLLGMDLVTAQKVAAIFSAASGILVTISIGLIIFALMTIGPEIFATFEGVASIATLFQTLVGSPLVAGATITFILGEVAGHIATGIPMITKQMVDNGSIAAGLRITAIKDAEDLRKKATGTSTPATFTAAEFTSLDTSLQAAGVTSINDPNKLQSVPYSKSNLADLIAWVYGSDIVAGTKATPSVIRQQIQQYLVTGAGVSGAAAAAIASSGAAAAASTTTVKVAPISKVYTGIVGQGVVGQGLVFTPRPDDLITSLQELTDAATNNLSSYLNALLGKIVYEVKIVPYVIDADGFKHVGTTQRIQSGTYKNGTPRYKTVTNKFAELVVYALTDKGTRAKLTTITLGPTDSSQLVVGADDLQNIQDQLPSLVTTTDHTEIANIASPAEATAQAQAQATAPVVSAAAPQTPAQIYEAVKTKIGNTAGATTSTVIAGITYDWKNTGGRFVSPDGGFELTPNGVIKYVPGTSAPAASGVAAGAGAGTGTKPGANATTLSDWYTANGKSLPTIAARGQLYQQLGLGQAAYYTGTAEQNTKLLAALKAQ